MRCPAVRRLPGGADQQSLERAPTTPTWRAAPPQLQALRGAHGGEEGTSAPWRRLRVARGVSTWERGRGDPGEMQRPCARGPRLPAPKPSSGGRGLTPRAAPGPCPEREAAEGRRSATGSCGYASRRRARGREFDPRYQAKEDLLWVAQPLQASFSLLLLFWRMLL